MSDDTTLDELLLRWEELRRQGQTPSAEDLCRDRPELLPALRQRMRALEAVGAMLATGSTGPAASTPADLAAGEVPRVQALAAQSRYRVLRFHARGGLGEVLLARDEELRRDVALKLIRPSPGDDGGRRGRFLREAELTGRLEHPGIVPVYAVGQDDTGQPWYAMRFIQGETLAEAIARFHSADGPGRDPAERGLALRQLLGRFVGACNAVAYAHHQGIVHRDLKPANIMLGPFGESLVVDWGLAKRLGGEEAPENRPPESTDAEPRPDDRQTQTGAALGTPAYMSPEQAAGRWDVVGPATDIYSLGATLYALLTGRAPHQPEAPARAVAVASGWSPRVPPALAAVCRKAMAAGPGDRYPSALALAADVEHWLGDEPVSAYPEPWAVRARRWVGRHRTLVTSAVAVTAVAAVLLAVAAGLLARVNERERQAADNARKQEERAEASYQLARQAVDDFYTTVSQNKLLRAPGAQPVRRELLLLALDYYKEFVKQRGDDPALQAKVALAYGRIGQIVGDVGSMDEALDWEGQAVARWRRLLEQSPGDPEYRHRLGEQLGILGSLQFRASRPEEAGRSWEEAIEVLSRLSDEDPANERVLFLLAQAAMNLAAAEGVRGRSEEAMRANARAAAVRERLLVLRPDDRKARLQAATGLNLLGSNQQDLGRWAEALQTWGRARAILEPMVREEEADPALRKDNTAGADARDVLAVNCFNTGYGHSLENRWQEAIPLYERARDLWAALRRDNPSVRYYGQYIPQAVNSIGHARLELGQTQQALADFREARAGAEKLLQEDDKLVVARTNLGLALDGLAAAQARLGQRDEALRLFAQGLEAHQEVLKKAPEVMDSRRWLAGHYRTLAGAHRDWGQPAEAAAALRQSRQACDDDATSLFNVAEGLSLCVPLVARGKSEPSAAERAERQKYADEAMEVLRQAVARGFNQAQMLQNDANLAPLRERDDFRKLSDELKQKQDEKSKPANTGG
jgi:serine/threonine-protein kinase